MLVDLTDELLREQERLKSNLAALDRVTVKQGHESERLIQAEVGLRLMSNQAAARSP